MSFDGCSGEKQCKEGALEIQGVGGIDQGKVHSEADSLLLTRRQASSCMVTWKRTIPGRGNSKCTSPGVKANLESWKNTKESSVAGVEQMRGRREDSIRNLSLGVGI